MAKIYQFINETEGSEFIVFVSNEDDATDDYLLPGYEHYATAEDVSLGRDLLPSEGDRYILKRD